MEASEAKRLKTIEKEDKQLKCNIYNRQFNST